MTQTTQLAEVLEQQTRSFQDKQFIDLIEKTEELDNIISTYEKAGLTRPAKIAKAAKHGYKYFTTDDISAFLQKYADRLNQSEEVQSGELQPAYTLTHGKGTLSYSEEGKLGRLSAHATESTPYTDMILDKQMVGRPLSGIVSQVKKMTRFGERKLDALTAITANRLENYTGIPPLEVAEKLSKAKNIDCFDYYEVLDAENFITKPRIKDPILCGKIDGYPDVFFFIAGWLKDVGFNQVLTQNYVLE